ncbi:Alpha/Beta hydrolase protein [Mortierella sp. GBAus27b]|nr:Alpha/Beta hydrolase protein [Mortierella sp. GBAus27b]
MATPQEIFKSLAAIPSYLDATVLPSSTDTTLNIQVLLSQRDLERNVKRKFTRTLVASVQDKDAPLVFSGPSIDTGDAIAQTVSPTGKFTVVLRSVVGEKKRDFVEIWSEGSILHLLETTSIHGGFYADSTFGTLEWSRDETKVVYVAERKASEDAAEKYNYKPDWGEAFTGKRDPSLVVLNLDNLEFKVLDPLENNMSPGQAIFTHDSKSLIFTGYHRDPQFFGIVYCQNRLTGLYQIDIDGSGFKDLTGDIKSARSPRLNKDGTTLVFLSNSVNGPHASCAKLCKIDIASGKISTVVDIVRKADPATGFPGLYIDQLPRKLWISSTKVVTSSAWRSRRALLVIDTETGTVEDLTPASQHAGATTVLYADSRWILATYSTPTEPWKLILGQINVDQSKTQVHFSTLENNKVEKARTYYEPHSWSIVDKIPGQLESLEVILLEPFKSDSAAQKSSAVGGSKPPLVIFPHGGPHSGFSTDFLLLSLVLVGLGFTVACVNFTGSLGFGQDNVEALVGRVGDLDIKECQAVRDHIISTGRVDADRVALTGGSHGGFIVAHLLADPSYKAAALRNPVTDIPVLTSTSDITEWGYAVNGLPFDMASPPTATLNDPEVFKKLRAASPMEHVEKVVAPTLVLLGSGDRRVHPSQGITWWQARQNKIKKDQKKDAVNRIQVFDGTGHALDSVEAESNSTYSIGSFLVEFTRIKEQAEGVGRQGEGGRGAFV